MARSSAHFLCTHFVYALRVGHDSRRMTAPPAHRSKRTRPKGTSLWLCVASASGSIAKMIQRGIRDDDSNQTRCVRRDGAQTNEWLNDVMNALSSRDQHQAYAAMRATRHALRDRLTVEEVAQFGAQLPMLIRGF